MEPAAAENPLCGFFHEINSLCEFFLAAKLLLEVGTSCLSSIRGFPRHSTWQEAENLLCKLFHETNSLCEFFLAAKLPVNRWGLYPTPIEEMEPAAVENPLCGLFH